MDSFLRQRSLQLFIQTLIIQRFCLRQQEKNLSFTMIEVCKFYNKEKCLSDAPKKT